MIRRAGPQDVASIVEMGANFHAYSPYSAVAYDHEATGAFISGLLDVGAVFLSSGGMVGGLISPLFFNPSVKVAAELFWWAPDGEGRQLRAAFEAWAAENDALVQFSALADENGGRMDKIYARAGYRRAETAYVKGL